jgi:hypothetical protein
LLPPPPFPAPPPEVPPHPEIKRNTETIAETRKNAQDILRFPLQIQDRCVLRFESFPIYQQSKTDRKNVRNQGIERDQEEKNLKAAQRAAKTTARKANQPRAL